MSLLRTMGSCAVEAMRKGRMEGEERKALR
jgi:hypothetical protein